MIINKENQIFKSDLIPIYNIYLITKVSIYFTQGLYVRLQLIIHFLVDLVLINL